jgi:ABC-type transporter Mla subunit MlaD
VKAQQDGINVGLKNGSLTKGQAKDLSAKVKAVKDQVRSDFKQNRENGQKGLTDDQVQQLNKMLDENAAAIPELSKAVHFLKKPGGNNPPGFFYFLPVILRAPVISARRTCFGSKAEKHL